VIKYGRYKLPISPITKGMGATVNFDKTTGILTVKKDNDTIIIDFRYKTVTINGVTDANSGIFYPKNNKRMTVLIQYIAKILGIDVKVDKDKVVITVPGLDNPTNITLTPVGGTVVPNTLNNTNLYLVATAKIKEGQATGGRAELYVGNKLVATDNEIQAKDTMVTFVTGDATPTNAELQAAIPAGGVVTVKLYNTKNQSVTSVKNNPTLVVDYGTIAPGLDNPTNVTVTPIGGTVVPNTLNNTNLYLVATANINAGQATGGRAELYVGTKLVATDYEILARDTMVTFITGDATPTNAELQAAVPAGGVVTVKLYNALNQSVTSIRNNPTLVVDYGVNPGLDNPTNVTVTPVGGTVVANTLNNTNLYLVATANIKAGQATGGRAELYVGTKLVATDYEILAADTMVTFITGDATPTNAELQAAVPTGGVVTVKLYNALNQSVTSIRNNPTLVVDYGVNPGLDNPTNVAVTPVGGTVVANTLNSTTLYLTATANIKAGQATGGRAELYVGNKLIAADYEILATDTVVTFNTADATPTNAKLQAIVPAGGVVTVKLYNAKNESITSIKDNPTLVVDYVAPTVTSINAAIYNVSDGAITLIITGGSKVGDKVDVTKITLYDTVLGKNYQLTNTNVIGSTGTITSENTIVINLGFYDKIGLLGFGGSTVYLNIASGSLLSDTAGNVSTSTTATQAFPLTIIN
jgi:hypothetical protein